MKFVRLGLLFLLFVLGTVVMAQDDNAADDNMADEPMSAQQPMAMELPMGQWTKIETGGDTNCLYGETVGENGGDYSFFVRPADIMTDKIMIYFQGGGACWDALTCSQIGGFASQYDVADNEMDFYRFGLFDYTNEANPVLDYHAIFLPYCSGDVFSGDLETTYDVPDGTEGLDADTIDVDFNGYNNTWAVLDWVYANFMAPEKIFVTGCSAGGYGAIYYAPYIMDHYRGVPAIMIADSSNGVLSDTWDVGFWDGTKHLPGFIDSFDDLTPETYTATINVIGSAEEFPDNVFAEYNTFYDTTQVGFFGLMLGETVGEDNFQDIAAQWTPQMLTNLAQMQATGNFASYTAGGGLHCIVNRPEAYTYEVAGVNFMDWVGNLLDEEVETVSCGIDTGECLAAPASAADDASADDTSSDDNMADENDNMADENDNDG